MKSKPAPAAPGVARFQNGGTVASPRAPLVSFGTPALSQPVPPLDFSLSGGPPPAPGLSFAPRGQLVSALAHYPSLAQARTGIGQELQDPETRRLLAASTLAEVGDQPQATQQAYMESAVNRAIAQQQSLASTLRSSYYPAATRNQLGKTFTPGQMEPYNQMIDSVTNGSNVSNLATGNESGKVRSGGADVVYPQGATHDSPGERFVAERGTEDWRNGLLPTLHFQHGGLVGYQNGGRVKPSEAAALQTAGQYGGGSQVLTPESAAAQGLDPSKGFINPDATPSASTDQQQLRTELKSTGALPGKLSMGPPLARQPDPGDAGFKPVGGEQPAPQLSGIQAGYIPEWLKPWIGGPPPSAEEIQKGKAGLAEMLRKDRPIGPNLVPPGRGSGDVTNVDPVTGAIIGPSDTTPSDTTQAKKSQTDASPGDAGFKPVPQKEPQKAANPADAGFKPVTPEKTAAPAPEVGPELAGKEPSGETAAQPPPQPPPAAKEEQKPQPPSGNPELQQLRTPFSQELADPAVRQRLYASVMAEVGDQGPEARVAYLESVMNRANARNKSLLATINDGSYYPSTTISKLGNTFSGATQAELDREITAVLGGSNISGYATGNESQNVHGPYKVFDPGTGERFIVENKPADLAWAKARGWVAEKTGERTQLSDEIAKSGILGGAKGKVAAASTPGDYSFTLSGRPAGGRPPPEVAYAPPQGGGGISSYGGGGGGIAQGQDVSIPIGAIGNMGGGGGGGAQQQQPAALKAARAAQAEEPPTLVAELTKRGWSLSDAQNYAKSIQVAAPGQQTGPPAAPGPGKTLSLPAPSGPPAAPGAAPSAQPGISMAASQAALGDAIKALQSLGIKKKQAQAMLQGAPQGATVEQLVKHALQAREQGKGGAVPKPRPTQTAQTTQAAPAQLPGPPAAPASTSGAPPVREAEVSVLPQAAGEGLRPAGSTVGVANPRTRGSIAGLLTSGNKDDRAAAQRQHAEALSEDDPRVKKQADNYTKGEHFVPGDELHEHYLNGLVGGQGGRHRQILSEGERAIAEDRPMHISYISSPKEAENFPTRDTRTIQYAEHTPQAREEGLTEGQLVGHSMIPVSVGITMPDKKGGPYKSVINGLSTNVMANNFHHINNKLAAMRRSTPFPQMDDNFFNKMEGYLHNMNAGHTGTGQGFQTGTEAHPTEPDLEHVPQKLTKAEADFLNLVINNTQAFSKNEQGQAIRDLARANGTLITENGETNKLRHDIEQQDPGWAIRRGSRKPVLEPSIKTFRTGLVHEIHPSVEHMPEAIRPGREYQRLAEAFGKTTERGRPDIPIAASLHTNFTHNKQINLIERQFSDGQITEAQARERLKDLGEDPEAYRYISGSGGLITPYEDNPEAITPQEHDELKTNLRKQWLGGKMEVEDYRRKAAEVPLPEIAARKSSIPKEPEPKPPKAVAPEEEPQTPSEEPEAPKPLTPVPKPPKAPKPAPALESEETPAKPEGEPEQAPKKPAPPPAPTAPEPKPKPAKAKTTPPVEEEEAPEDEGPPPAPGAGETFTPAPQKKPGKEKKSKEEEELEAEDLRQAAADRDNISDEDRAKRLSIQKKAKAWIAKNKILHGLSMHAYLTGQKKFPGKLKKEGIGEHFDATNPKLDYSKEEHRQAAADAVVHDVMHSLAGTTTNDEPSSAYGWYDRTVRKTMAKIGEIAPEILSNKDHELAYKLALAITSQGQDVFPNAESAWHIYQHWKNNGAKAGGLPTTRDVFGGGLKAEQMEQNLAKINDLWAKHGTEGLRKILMTEMTSRELKEKYGLDSGEKADYRVNGAMGLGPKIGAFFSNLNGDFDPTTIDLWFSRNMNLMAGNMFNFSDKATRQDRMEKGELVKSHLSDLKDLLDSGMVTNMPKGRAAKMAKELGKLQAHPEGQLDRRTAKELAPEIYNWAREQHKVYQKSYGSKAEGDQKGSYHADFKTPVNLTGKKLDEGATDLSDAPRTTTERDHWRNIMERADKTLKENKVNLTNADKQALLWFNIKDLFKMAGSPQRAKADYLDAAYRLVRKVKTGKLQPRVPLAPQALAA